MRPTLLLRPVAVLGEVVRHWGRERGTLRQGFTALSICLGVTVLAGVVLGAMEGLLTERPGLAVLVPAAIGMRGAIFGALGARLGTGMLTGQVGDSWHRRTFTGQNIEASALLTIVTAVGSAIAARAVAGIFSLPTISTWELIVVSTIGALVSSGVILLAVLLLARSAQRRSWDMDAIGTPIITATADISTLPGLVVGVLVLITPAVHVVAGALFVAAAAWAGWAGLRDPRELVRRIVRESLPVLAYVTVLDILAGTVLEARLDDFDTQAVLVAVIPFIATCGALGGILSARLASQLHLGLLTPRGWPERPALLEGSLTVLFALIGFSAVGFLAWALSATAGYRTPALGSLVGATLIGGMLATVVLFVVAYYAASYSYRFGLDPDNYGIPIVTATMDFSGIVCLVAGISVLGVS